MSLVAVVANAEAGAAGAPKLKAGVLVFLVSVVAVPDGPVGALKLNLAGAAAAGAVSLLFCVWPKLKVGVVVAGLSAVVSAGFPKAKAGFAGCAAVLSTGLPKLKLPGVDVVEVDGIPKDSGAFAD